MNDGISPQEIVKFEDNIENLPTRVLEDVLVEIIDELKKRGIVIK